MGLPGLAETDVGGANGAPDEEVGQTGNGKQPGEDGALFCGLTNEGQEAEENLNNNAPNGPTASVDISQDLGSHTSLGHSLHCTRGAEGARVGDRDDREGDDGVEDGRKHFDASVLNRQNERAGLGVGTTGAQQSLVVRSDDQSKNEQIDDVEEEDSPKDLLGGAGNSLPRVGGLGSSKTDKLSTTEREGSRDEDGAKTVEAVSKGAGVVPVLGAQVSLVTNATAVDDNAEDDEANTSADLDHGKDEFNFSVATNTKHLDRGKHNQEDGDPDTHVKIISPERDGDGGGDKFKGQNGKP